MNPPIGPLSYEVLHRRRRDQLLVSQRTASLEEATAIYDQLREAGEFPSLFLGGMLLREEDDDPAATNRRRLTKLRAGEGPLSKIRVGAVESRREAAI